MSPFSTTTPVIANPEQTCFVSGHFAVFLGRSLLDFTPISKVSAWLGWEGGVTRTLNDSATC
jgi:hypothetical protein